MRNYKSKRDCPEKLDILIKDVNKWLSLLPLYPLKPIRKKSGKALKIGLQNCLENTPEAFQKHINNSALRYLHRKGIDNYSQNELVAAKTKMYLEFRSYYNSIIGYVKHLELERKVTAKHDNLTYFSFLVDSVEIRTFVKRVYPGKKSSLGKQYLTGLAGLIGTFDDNRLRMCRICKRIFWATKTNAETCGIKKCADDLGNEKRLAKTRTEKLNQKEKKKNGTL
jgi:hypothetical protein